MPDPTPLSAHRRDEIRRAASALVGIPHDPATLLVVPRTPLAKRLLTGEPTGPLDGIVPVARLDDDLKVVGPNPSLVALDPGMSPWFDVYGPAQHVAVQVAGDAEPLLLLTAARLATGARPRRTVKLDPGTVWIRADAVGPGFPAQSYVGIRHGGGTLDLGRLTPAVDGVVTATAPFSPVLTLAISGDTAVAAPGGCDASGAAFTPPTSLRIALTPGGAVLIGDGATAAVWGASLTGAPTGAAAPWTFLPRLWTAVAPLQVVADPAPAAVSTDDGVTRIAGELTVVSGGIAWPVVQSTDPAVLGEAARGARFAIDADGLTAAWYEDARPHALGRAHVAVSDRGVLVWADDVAPLDPPIEQEYDLWRLASAHRLPWRTRYAEPFWVLVQCDVADGASVIADPTPSVQLDRPVTAAGLPVQTAATHGAVALQRSGGRTRLSAVAALSGKGGYPFVLSNAMVWVKAPESVAMTGVLGGPRETREGALTLPLPVGGWMPTLPDPYVSTLAADRGRAAGGGRLAATVRWTADAAASVDVAGTLGGVRGTPLPPTDGGPRPGAQGSSPVAPTEVEQHTLLLDERTSRDRDVAQAEAADGRARKVSRAEEQDAASRALVESALGRVMGAAPDVLLLDVSTNQDLLGVGLAAPRGEQPSLPVERLEVSAPAGLVRIVALPQLQWEPVRTLDPDQKIAEMGWFPTPLASADDGGATQIGMRSQRLVPVVPADALQGAVDEFRAGTSLGVRTTFPFGLVAGVRLQAVDDGARRADLVDLVRPRFDEASLTGGLQLAASAEGGRAPDGGISPFFEGVTRQLLNGVDLTTGSPLGISVLGSTSSPESDVETVFNGDMAAEPKVPLTRFDVSGYGGSSFSDWQNPFSAYADAAKVQFAYVVGRTMREVVKVNSVFHPFAVRMTRSVTIERRPGGGVIRRDSGWQAVSDGLFDYRYVDEPTRTLTQPADYRFDAGVFRGLFHVRNVRPAPGSPVSVGGATFVPYLIDADVALESVPGLTSARGILGYLQTAPHGLPASAAALRTLLKQNGPAGGPVDTWMTVGESGLPFRAQRIEVDVADDAGGPVFVATVRGAPQLPTTGAWSVVRRGTGSADEAMPVGDGFGVPLIRRNPVTYPLTPTPPALTPPMTAPSGDHRLADPADLLTTSPATEYALLQSTPTHAVLFPRPYSRVGAPGALLSDGRLAIADVIARSATKGSFPSPAGTIELAPGASRLDVGPGGTLALPGPVTVVGHPTPLQLAGTTGHGTTLRYDSATLRVELDHDHWSADFSGLRLWSDIAGVVELTGQEMRIVGSSTQRPQIAELRSLLLAGVEKILQYIPLFGARGTSGPVDLGATNAKHELKFVAKVKDTFPKKEVSLSEDPPITLTIATKATSGFDLATGGLTASAGLEAELEGRFGKPYFVIVSLKVGFTMASTAGTVTSEELELTAFAGVGVRGNIGPFQAYAFVGVGFVFDYDAVTHVPKYGGLVALEAGVHVKIVDVKIRAELKGLVYDDGGTTKCDYSGSVEINVEVFFLSISASYSVSSTTTL